MDNLSEQKYLSSKDAGALLGYTHDYISRLCRQGRMSGIQKGREWYVTQAELDAFKARHEIFLQEKKKELSKKFSKIRLEAEARKRELRKQSDQVVKVADQNKEDTYSEYSHKKVSLSMPKQFVAALFLLTCLCAPALGQIFNAQDSIQEFTSTVEQGIQDTIYAESTVIEPVAAVFSFAPYLADGYWQFFMTVAELPREVLSSMKGIGEGYLALYVFQGQMLYETGQSMDNMGATVLRGYELIGESFLFGGKDILNRYEMIFSTNTNLDFGVQGIKTFTANVSGGFDIVSTSIEENIFVKFTNKVTHILNDINANVGGNLSSTTATISQVSNSMLSYIGSLFEFNLVEKESKIRAIKLQK